MEYQRGAAVQPPKYMVPKQMTLEDDGLQRAMDELGQTETKLDAPEELVATRDEDEWIRLTVAAL